MTETAELILYRLVKQEISKNTVHVKPANQPPHLLVDSHMHIQSGRCSTLLFLRSQIPVPNTLDRPLIEWSGKHIGGGLKRITKESSHATDIVGDAFLVKLDELYQEFRSKETYKQAKELVICSVVMTMDMEYAHLGGYFGLRIYNPIYPSQTVMEKQDPKPHCYWYPKPGTSGTLGNRNGAPAVITDPRGETTSDFETLKRAREREGVAGFIYQKGMRKIVPIMCRIAVTPESEGDRYENWKTQLKCTINTAVKGRLKLLPMYHYDPRRWQKGDDDAFKEIALMEQGGLFLGFKMYTAQGYRPWDPNRLANLPGFYAKCQEKGIPILNHCTSAGAPTYDRESYILFSHPNDTIEDENEKTACMEKFQNAVERSFSAPPGMDTDTPQFKKWEQEQKKRMAASMAATDYFNEHFVSPNAWKKVLKEYPNLRLCLAHFGGNKPMERKWGKEIAVMMEAFNQATGKIAYPNFYADISSSFGNPEFRDHFKTLLHDHPRIQERTLFGTDWYLTLLEKIDLVKYCSDAKDFLDGIDKKLWPKFTQENPYRFFRLGEQIELIGNSLITEGKTDNSREETRSKGRKSEGENNTPAEMQRALTAYNGEITTRVKIIQQMASTLAR